jgi:hypothetical protein
MRIVNYSTKFPCGGGGGNISDFQFQLLECVSAGTEE